jgi:hypothetical protein
MCELKNIGQKHFPWMTSIIELLLVSPKIKSSPELEGAVTTLKDLCKEAWDIVDEASADDINDEENTTSSE